MSSTITDAFRELCVHARVAIGRLRRDECGQTAAEYMGMLLLIAAIIYGLVIAVDLDGEISRAAESLVNSIKGGGEPGPPSEG